MAPSTPAHRAFSDLAQRYSDGYISDISPEDVSLAREFSNAHSEFHDIDIPQNDEANTMLKILKLKVGTFPVLEKKEPIVINSMLLLVVVTENEHLREVALRFLGNANILSISTLLDELENSLHFYIMTFDLNGKWSLRDSENTVNIEALVPGNVRASK